jgi:hypothetical protein
VKSVPAITVVKDEMPETSVSGGSEPLAWVVSADMGYGHNRAAYPLRHVAEGGIISVGESDATSLIEKKLWRRLLWIYESFSRARSIPLIGRYIFGILDTFLRIPTLYPLRNLSESTFQVELLESFIDQGLCEGLLERIKGKRHPLVTSFYAPAIAADRKGTEKIYCIICDADLNRVWVAREPWESRIEYFAPCGRVVQRLKAYGVPEDRIFLTGFPLPEELVGGEDMATLKSDLGQRLFYLDPKERFWPRYGMNVNHFLGTENCTFKRDRILTITYSVGGAGALKEIGAKIARSLREHLIAGELRLNLAAGTKESVRQYYQEVKASISDSCDNIRIISADTVDEYFAKFNAELRTTDVLWTKPSELSFYAALGIPIIMTSALGSQETFNQKWLRDIQAGIRQENPDYTHQWFMDLLNKGRLAEAAWSGFLKARKLGTYRIKEVLRTGSMKREVSPIRR